MLPAVLQRNLRGDVHQLKTWTLGAALVAALAGYAACGDDSSGDGGGPDGTTTDDAGGSDAVTPDDGGSDATPTGCVPIDGGLPCDPGHVACGAATCDTSKQVCCFADGGAKATCTTPRPTDGGKPPANACVGTEAFCDEAADCPAGQVCCGFVGSTGGFATSCATSCGTGLQFCHGNAECVSGTCTAQQCRGETIETCSSICP